jgi:ubiquitin-like-conjugating enzyme ATG3
VVIEGDDADNGWAMTLTDGLAKPSGEEEEIPDLDQEEAVPDKDESAAGAAGGASGSDSDDIPDIEEFDDNNLIAGEALGALSPGGEDNLMKTRTYDLYLTYDQYHQTPKVYLQGYAEDGELLTPEQTFEDIASDYVHTTVSIETHPHLPIVTAFIHPCRHAETMHRMISVMKGHSGSSIRADQMMFLFLKFIASVIPTIQYDFTATVDVGK